MPSSRACPVRPSQDRTHDHQAHRPPAGTRARRSGCIVFLTPAEARCYASSQDVGRGHSSVVGARTRDRERPMTHQQALSVSGSAPRLMARGESMFRPVVVGVLVLLVAGCAQTQAGTGGSGFTLANVGSSFALDVPVRVVVEFSPALPAGGTVTIKLSENGTELVALRDPTKVGARRATSSVPFSDNLIVTVPPAGKAGENSTTTRTGTSSAKLDPTFARVKPDPPVPA